MGYLGCDVELAVNAGASEIRAVEEGMDALETALLPSDELESVALKFEVVDDLALKHVGYVRAHRTEEPGRELVSGDRSSELVQALKHQH